jgi:DNA recombination protein RmuC
MQALPDTDGILIGIALGVLLILILLLLLLRAVRRGGVDGLDEKLRLIAEQILSGLRSETETTRVLLGNSERNMMTMLADLRGVYEQRAGALAADQAERLGRLENAITGQLGALKTGLETRFGDFSVSLMRGQGEQRALLETKLREMTDHTTQRLAEIQKSVNEQLSEAVEKQMQTSFQRVADQLGAVQKAMVDVQAVTAQIGDIKRIFSNVKARGSWGETQLRAQIEDLLPPDAYVVNARLSETSTEFVEFAVKIPMRGIENPPLLPIDAKFPVSDYERLLAASEAGDADGERQARRALETRFRQEGKKIAEKYIVANVTTEFAVMYLPTDGLYAEAARIPGLIDDLGRNQHVMVMGPSLLPALLRTVRLGYMTLQLEEKAAQIAQILGATKQEMQKMDQALERLSKNAGTMSKAIEDARMRTRAVTRKLRGVEVIDAEQAAKLLEIEDETEQE